MKKSRTLFISLLFLGLLLFPIKQTQAETIAQGTEDNYSWSIEDGLLTVTCTDTTTPYLNNTGDDMPWYEYADQITSVKIDDTFRIIGQYTFKGCQFSSVTLPANLTMWLPGIFYDCDKLASISISSTNTSFTVVDNVLFSSNKQTLYYYPMADTRTSYAVPSGTLNIYASAIYKPLYLTSITLPDGLLSLGYNAIYCTSGITSITIPESVQSMEANSINKKVTIIIKSDNLLENEDGSYTYFENGTNDLLVTSSGDTIYVPKSTTNNGKCMLTSVTQDYTLDTAECYTYGDGSASFASSPISSHLLVQSDGTWQTVTVAYNEDDVAQGILIHKYNANFKLNSTSMIKMELPLYGGFYNSGSYYYIVYGHSNTAETESQEVIRIVKYDHNWKRIDGVSIYGANTYLPFTAASLRMTEDNGTLYIRTGHQMYHSADLVRHQANMTITVDTASMTVTDCAAQIQESKFGYVSHSFNQFILVNDGLMVALDHGDAYPRAATLNIADMASDDNATEIEAVTFPGSTGENYTGASLGGFHQSSNNYIIAGTKTNTSTLDYDAVQNIFITTVNKSDTSKITTKQITNYTGTTSQNATTPHLVKINDNSFLLLWTKCEHSLL